MHFTTFPRILQHNAARQHFCIGTTSKFTVGSKRKWHILYQPILQWRVSQNTALASNIGLSLYIEDRIDVLQYQKQVYLKVMQRIGLITTWLEL